MVSTLPLSVQTSLKSTTVSPSGDVNDRRDVITMVDPSNFASPDSVIPDGALIDTLLPSSLKTADVGCWRTLLPSTCSSVAVCLTTSWLGNGTIGVLPAMFGLLFAWLKRHVPEKSGRPCANAAAWSTSARHTPATIAIRFMVQTPAWTPG